MLNQSLHINAVLTQVEVLTKTLLEQEQFFLKNYLSVSNDPHYHALTDNVNSESLKLGNILKEHNIEASFDSKVTLVDDTMDTLLLTEGLLDNYNGKIHIESRSCSQLVVYTSEIISQDVLKAVNTLNRNSGIVSVMNVLNRLSRPYIVGLHSWRDAHNIKSLINTELGWKEAS